MSNMPWLSLMIGLPFLGSLWLTLMRFFPILQNPKQMALGFSTITFCLSLIVAWTFDPLKEGFQFQETYPWVSTWNTSYALGIDGVSLLFILLSTFLTPLAILISWHTVKTRVHEFMAAFLLLETLTLGVFCCLDCIFFYIFFEAVLIPMFLIIGIWGGERRVYSAFKFFLYTLLGSVFMLLAILYICNTVGSSSILQSYNHTFSYTTQKWLWLAFFFSFAVKLPVWPVHTWLPDAHVEAPTAGSVILAGILLKMGGYGFLRFSLPLFPEATLTFAPWVIALSLIAIVYTSLIALVQTDIKKLIAYSSVAHMGFVTLGLFSLTPQGISGALFQMISHGLISGALFLAIGMVYERLHTRDMEALGGLVKPMPKYAFCLLIFVFASIGLPGTTGFVGEFLVLIGAFHIGPYVAALAASGMVLGAAYGLWFYRKTVFETAAPQRQRAILSDLSAREACILAPLVIAIIVLGVYPAPILKIIESTVTQILSPYTNRSPTLSQANPKQISTLTGQAGDL